MDEDLICCSICSTEPCRRVTVVFPDRSASPGARMHLCESCIDRYVGAGASVDPPTPALW